MPKPDDHVEITSQTRFLEVAGILATGFLRLKYRRGHIEDAWPDTPEPPPVATHSVPEKAAGIYRN